MKATIIEITKRKQGWGFRAKARNGEILATSETYTRSHDAERGARRAFPQVRHFKWVR